MGSTFKTSSLRGRQTLLGRIIALAAFLLLLQALLHIDTIRSRTYSFTQPLQHGGLHQQQYTEVQDRDVPPPEFPGQPLLHHDSPPPHLHHLPSPEEHDSGLQHQQQHIQQHDVLVPVAADNGKKVGGLEEADSPSSPSSYSGDLLCPTCQCSEPDSYAEELNADPTRHALTPDELRAGSYSAHRLHQYIHRNVFRSSREDPVRPFGEEERQKQLAHHRSCPDTVFSANLSSLEPFLPTSYIFTRVAMAGGRLGNVDLRLAFLGRHVRTFNAFRERVTNEGYLDGKKVDDRQLLWILVEDGTQIEPTTAAFLKESGIPHIYFAHGPTRYYGLPQWNVVLSVVGWLRSHLYGDGPVVSVDDDSWIKPELLRKIWKVERAITWQVGNIGKEEDGNREGPIVVNGKLERWACNWKPERTFPIDMGGYAVNSSLITDDGPLRGPWHVPSHQLRPEDSSSESQFLEKIYQSREEMEFLCENTVAEECYYAWHNEGGNFW